MKIDRAVMAGLICAGNGVGGPFCDGRADRPPKWINGANREDGGRAIPARIAQRFPSILGAERLERPRGVRAEFRGNAQLAENFLRLDIARYDHGIAAVTLAHSLRQRIHDARFSAVGNAQPILRGSNSQRADEHGGESIAEFAFESGAFTGDDRMVLANLGMQKRRKDVG